MLGIALRVQLDSRPADLLFSTTGRGVPGRFLLCPRRAATVSPTTHSTLQPYRTPTGPVVLAATPSINDSGIELRVSAARPTGAWHEFGSVHVDTRGTAHDEPVSFDPMLNEFPEMPNYRWISRLREGAYRAARRSRSDAAA